MKAAGIVCEYNPFHNGHAYHIAQTRKRGYSHIAAVMSSNLVQRGGLALVEKQARAKAALLCGADLVLELPAPWAGASAERFALGAVFLLESLGCLSGLSFGSERGEPESLREAARLLREEAFQQRLKRLLREGDSYPAARWQLLEQAGCPPLGPNDLLGVEYAKALAFFGSSMELTAIPRFGADHDGPLSSGCGPMASASALRRLVEKQGWNGAASYLPEQALGLFSQEPLSQPQRLDRALLLKLRQMEPEQFAALPDCTEGLDRRLYRCARQAGSIEELLQAVKTKRYPLSRLRRILAAAAVGMTGEDQRRLPPYLRVLAANSRGLELLAAAKRRRCSLPIHFSLAKLRGLGGAAERTARLEAAATDLFFCSTEKISPCGLDYTRKAVIMKENIPFSPPCGREERS